MPSKMLVALVILGVQNTSPNYGSIVFIARVGGSCWGSCDLHCQVLHSTREAVYTPHQKGPWR